MDIPVAVMECMLGTIFNTFATGNTTLRVGYKLDILANTLWIMAPPTGQSAALQENSRPDTGSVMNGIAFYSEQGSSDV